MIGKRIKSIRLMRGMSTADVAEIAGVSRRTIEKWEAGEASPPLDKTAHIATALKFSIDELIVNLETSENLKWELSSDEIYLIMSYRSLSSESKTLITLVLDHEKTRV